MPAIDTVHPDVQQLSAFGLGRLGAAESAAIEQHLAECETCRNMLDTLPADSFVNLVRAAEAPIPAPAAATLPQHSSPGSATPAIPPELANHPRYRVVELLGVGGMGAVFKAEHLIMERPVALKIINRELLDNPATVERFRREVKAAGQLTHPNIVHAYDADQAGETHFLVMEFVEGISLAKLVEERGPLPVAQSCDYIRQAALGLQHAHERGMVHRDIKPHNLMVTANQQIKILDCGLARFAIESVPSLAQAATVELAKSPTITVCPQTPAPSLTQAGAVMGTPDYIAPEQARDAHSADIRADIYSLGCTLYDLLSGKPPFPEGTAVQKIISHLERTPKSLRDVRPGLPPELVDLVEKMMAKDPADRFQTPAEVAAVMLPWTMSEPEASAKETKTFAHASGSARRGHRRWYFAGAAVLLLLASFALAPVRDFAVNVIRIATNTGELIIETDDEDVEFTIKQPGTEPITGIIHKKAKRSFILSAVDGQIEAREKGDGNPTITTDFKLTGGGKQVIKAQAMFGAVRVEHVLLKASVSGKYKELLRKIKVDADIKEFGKFFDFGPYSGKEWAGHKELPAGYWVYVYPHWYIWKDSSIPPPPVEFTQPPLFSGIPVDKEKPPAELSKAAAFKKATINGKYHTLLKEIKVADDWQTYSAFVDYGPYSGTEWAGYKDLPPGYWVYVYPNWYIWKGRIPETAPVNPGGKDWGDLQGKWIPVAGYMEGKALSKEMLKEFTSMEFTGVQVSYTKAGKTEKGTFTLDDTKMPKWITVTWPKGLNEFEILEGIYDLDGDTLKLCMGDKHTTRPKTFASSVANKSLLFIILKKENALAFQPLFNGKDLTGWVAHVPKSDKQIDPNKLWEVNGNLVIGKTGHGATYLRTAKTYQNFILKFEYRSPPGPGGNAGIFLLGGAPDKIWPQSLQIDLAGKDGVAPVGVKYLNNSIVVVPTSGLGVEWHSLEVIANNGTIEFFSKGALLGKVENCEPQQGFIGLYTNKRELHVRNIEIKELPPPG